MLDDKTIAATHYLEGDARSQEPVVSADGRFLVFTSRARNLVPGGRGNGAHVYVRDMQGRTTKMVDLNENGSEANDDSVGPSVSADGQVIAFTSAASNLVSGDNVADLSVFVRDLRRGTSERVSVSSEGLQANAMSFRATICADGRFVTFTSAATNLVPGDTQGRWGVFVRDRKLGITERVSVASDGRDADDDSRGSSISADGRVIAFNSRATNLVPEADEGTWHV